jgi:hypothetical protein
MLRSFLICVALVGLVAMADQAEAGRHRRGGCSGGSCYSGGYSSGGCNSGSCGVSYGGCQGGVCSVPTPAPVAVRAGVALPASPTAAKVQQAAPTKAVATVNSGYSSAPRYARRTSVRRSR